MLKVRRAEITELDWINERYREVEFIPSHFENEVIAIAEYNTERAGIGRLVGIDGSSFELGGMYVFEAFRKLGAARAIAEFLLSHVQSSQTVYCIPFEHLIPFYQQFGFSNCETDSCVPDQILEKYQWCKRTYCSNTALLKRTSAYSSTIPK